MPLLNDGFIAQIEDLRSYESSVLDTASVEGVSLSPKMDMAQRQVATEVLRFLISQLEPGEAVMPAMLERVVVTDPLLRWHALHTLELFFRDVHHNQINDRYKAKWKAYEEEAREAQRLLYEVGVGLVSQPLPKPRALVVSEADGVQSGVLLLRAAWQRGGNESAPSEAVLFEPSVGSVAPVVALTDPPAGATGWNLYAGLPDEALARQNSEPLGLDAVWTMPAEGLVMGPGVPVGQSPDRWVRQRRVFLRG